MKTKQQIMQIKQQIREYFVEQYDYCLRVFEHRIGDDTNITRTTKVFSYKKYLKRLPSLNKDMKTILDYTNLTWAKGNDGSPIYINENNHHYLFDCSGYVPLCSIPEWEVDVNEWLDQKVEEVYHELYD